MTPEGRKKRPSLKERLKNSPVIVHDGEPLTPEELAAGRTAALDSDQDNPEWIKGWNNSVGSDSEK